MRIASSLAALALASSLLACTDGVREDIELPATIVDGKTDSWGHPTAYGTLFENTWQFGALDPSTSQRYPAWSFFLDGSATVTVLTRVAPTDQPALRATVLYLYKQREVGTWERIARTEPGDSFARLTKSLETGAYRVIAKGLEESAAGEFMLKLACTGDGCADGPQCLVGDTFNALRGAKAGAVIDDGKTVLTAASELTEPLKAQIIAAVRESSHDDVTTIEGAFAAVDQNEVNRFRFRDTLAGRTLVAIEYGAGDNSYGAFFVEDSATVAAGIHDGEIAGCTLAPQACVFGQTMGDAAFMPNLKTLGSQDYRAATGIDGMLAKQVVATFASTGATTVEAAIAAADDNTIYVEQLKHADGRRFVAIHYYGGDNPVGAYFAADSDVPVALNGDGDLSACTAY